MLVHLMLPHQYYKPAFLETYYSRILISRTLDFEPPNNLNKVIFLPLFEHAFPPPPDFSNSLISQTNFFWGGGGVRILLYLFTKVESNTVRSRCLIKQHNVLVNPDLEPRIILNLHLPVRLITSSHLSIVN